MTAAAESPGRHGLRGPQRYLGVRKCDWVRLISRRRGGCGRGGAAVADVWLAQEHPQDRQWKRDGRAPAIIAIFMQLSLIPQSRLQNHSRQ